MDTTGTLKVTSESIKTVVPESCKPQMEGIAYSSDSDVKRNTKTDIVIQDGMVQINSFIKVKQKFKESHMCNFYVLFKNKDVRYHMLRVLDKDIYLNIKNSLLHWNSIIEIHIKNVNTMIKQCTFFSYNCLTKKYIFKKNGSLIYNNLLIKSSGKYLKFNYIIDMNDKNDNSALGIIISNQLLSLNSLFDICYEKVSNNFVSLTTEKNFIHQKLRKSCKVFLQNLPCYKLQNRTDDVPMCRECSLRCAISPDNLNDINCRFLEFRRLQYTEHGYLLVSGFPNPFIDPTREDINIWNPDRDTKPTSNSMDLQVCRYILLHIGDQFCYLWHQECEALKLHENKKNTIAWKKTVQGVREICDVCDTTLFNYHWTCDKCGFGVCLDCFKNRKENRLKMCFNNKTQRGHDEYHWLMCTNTLYNKKHRLNELMLTQIIAGDSLNELGRLLHEVRKLWQIPEVCGCRLSKQKDCNSKIVTLAKDAIEKSQLVHFNVFSVHTNENLIQQTLMEKLHLNKLEFNHSIDLNHLLDKNWKKQTIKSDNISTAYDDYKHINFLQRGLAGLRRFLPPCPLTSTLSKQVASNVPHEWLCDGKLLRLTNPVHPGNHLLFQEVWKCGQPVIISEVARSLNLNLWRPEAFCTDFGDVPNDLINCLNGNLVPNQPMRLFWEGFESVQKRLIDSNGKQMLLKLKDWPPGDDFAEILPTRFDDLMKGLPMPEYTLRSGNLNLASCLPKMFVPPDLGPKMYNAYGSAFYPDKGTTNLHLDISDAVNIMVYVGIPHDFDNQPQMKATHRAIASGGCGYKTRTRSASSDVLPGALWHIFSARDADKIRDLLNRITLEKGYRLAEDHDPIHDQNWYLDECIRERLFREYGVQGYPIVQCQGDAVFIPAGAPHQVQNLHNCIKVAEDFVSPENITHCYHLTYEFRRLSNSHSNHEDKLQIKNIIYHAIKDCCTILSRALEQYLKEI